MVHVVHVPHQIPMVQQPVRKIKPGVVEEIQRYHHHHHIQHSPRAAQQREQRVAAHHSVPSLVQTLSCSHHARPNRHLCMHVAGVSRSFSISEPRTHLQRGRKKCIYPFVWSGASSRSRHQATDMANTEQHGQSSSRGVVVRAAREPIKSGGQNIPGRVRAQHRGGSRSLAARRRVGLDAGSSERESRNAALLPHHNTLPSTAATPSCRASRSTHPVLCIGSFVCLERRFHLPPHPAPPPRRFACSSFGHETLQVSVSQDSPATPRPPVRCSCSPSTSLHFQRKLSASRPE